MKQNAHLSKKIERTKERIQKIAPKVSAMEVKVEREGENFGSFIKVHIPPKKEIFAHKIDESAPHALEKTQDAVIKQIKKLKTKRARTKPA